MGGGWLTRSVRRVGAARLFKRRVPYHRPLPTRSLRDHPPHEGEGELRLMRMQRIVGVVLAFEAAPQDVHLVVTGFDGGVGATDGLARRG